MNVTKNDVGRLVMCTMFQLKMLPSRKVEPYGPFRIEVVKKNGDVVLVHVSTGEKVFTSGKWIAPASEPDTIQ